MTNRNSALLFIIFIFLVAGILACTKSGPSPEINVTGEGIAIKGYDPVAYFTDMKPERGSPDLSYRWKGAVWRFSTSVHLEAFKADPEKYAPKYGGYCAYAVSQDKLADIDPDAWTIYEGRLYLNLNKDVQRLWEKDKPGYILSADRYWPGVLKK